MNIKIIVVLALLVLAVLNYKRILSFIDYIQEKKAIEFKKRTNLDLHTLTRISAPPMIILYLLENYFLNRSIFYFDENNLYKINRKNPVVKHSLSNITEVRRTAVKINKRRVWKIIINDTDKLTVYKVRSNYGSFDLFLNKIAQNLNAIVDSKYVWKFFQ